MAKKERPKIGIGVIVVNDGKVLLGKRKGSHGEGMWSFPGGHLEFNESLEGCAKREVLEETGIIIKNLRKGPYTNDVFPDEKKHYVTLFIVGDHESGTATVMEPEKCEGWDWFEWGKFPQPLFIPIQNLLKESKKPF